MIVTRFTPFCNSDDYAGTLPQGVLLGRERQPDVKRRAEEALELFRLQAVRNRHSASLSGGEKQRVVIAAAYCSDAKVFVFDEPTSGMDGEGLLCMAHWMGRNYFTRFVQFNRYCRSLIIQHLSTDHWQCRLRILHR